jgi:hypothetical protein
MQFRIGVYPTLIDARAGIHKMPACFYFRPPTVLCPVCPVAVPTVEPAGAALGPLAAAASPAVALRVPATTRRGGPS